MPFQTKPILSHAKVTWLDGLVEYVPTHGASRVASFKQIKAHYAEDGRVASIEEHWVDVGAQAPVHN